MNDNIIPFAFDAGFYNDTNSDLSHLTADEAVDHFMHFGIAEGRQGHPRGSRGAFTDHICSYGSVFEIGPFCNPATRGLHVRYVDVLDATEL